jgi:hypothetical protein
MDCNGLISALGMVSFFVTFGTHIVVTLGLEFIPGSRPFTFTTIVTISDLGVIFFRVVDGSAFYFEIVAPPEMEIASTIIFGFALSAFNQKFHHFRTR